MSQARIEVNRIELAYLEQGEGPLALCLHGFPDSPATYRYLLPALAEAGYRAVAPYLRGFAPSGIPSGPVTVADLVADANALHEALGGEDDAVIIGHDWGALATWGAVNQAPQRWSKVVGMDVPPFPYMGRAAATFEAIKALNHFWFLQMKVADAVLPAADFAYIDYLWQTWAGPGYDATDDLPAAKACVRDPAHQAAVLSLYRSVVDRDTYGTEAWVAEYLALLGTVPTKPTLYLHGPDNGVLPVSDALLAELAAALPEGSEVAVIDGAGHFSAVEKPDDVNGRILAFLATTP